MSFWSGEKLEYRLLGEGLVTPFKKERIDCASYTLTLGGSAFTSSDGQNRAEMVAQGKSPGEWNVLPGKTVTIQSGQFALLLTNEIVTIPEDAVGFISIKAKAKFDGLINVSGFHVDPGWKGRLIFAVFNAGPQDLVYERGMPLFLLFMADLERRSESVKKSNPNYERIPADFMQRLGGDVPSLYKVKKKTNEIESQIKAIETRTTITYGLAGTALMLALAAFTMVASKTFFPPDNAKAGAAGEQVDMRATDSPAAKNTTIQYAVPASATEKLAEPRVRSPGDRATP